MSLIDNTEPAHGVVTTVDGTLVPSNTVNLPKMVRAIRAQAGGTIKILGKDAVAATLYFSDGETRTVWVRRIFVTGTTATGIEGMY